MRKEKEILPVNPQTPYKHLSIGRYYRYKGAFLIKTGSLDEGIDSYINGLCAYGEVNAYQEITECMNDILSQFSMVKKSIDLQYVDKLKEMYSRIIGNKHNVKEEV